MPMTLRTPVAKMRLPVPSALNCRMVPRSGLKGTRSEELPTTCSPSSMRHKSQGEPTDT